MFKLRQPIKTTIAKIVECTVDGKDYSAALVHDAPAGWLAFIDKNAGTHADSFDVFTIPIEGLGNDATDEQLLNSLEGVIAMELRGVR